MQASSLFLFPCRSITSFNWDRPVNFIPVFPQVILVQVNPGEAFTIRREDGQFQCITGKTAILFFLNVHVYLFSLSCWCDHRITQKWAKYLENEHMYWCNSLAVKSAMLILKQIPLRESLGQPGFKVMFAVADLHYHAFKFTLKLVSIAWVSMK